MRALRSALRTFRLMVAISLRADRWRSIAALVTASLQMIVLPLRAIGLATIANGVVARSMTQALAGAFLVVGLTAVNRIMAMASLTVRMRLRENTQLYLDTYLMGLTAGVPGIAHHELPNYLDRVELLRNGRNELANPFNPISWTLASLVQIASATFLLAGVEPLLALVPLAGIPAAYLSVRTQQRTSAQLEDQAEDNRILRHLFELATTAGPAKEIRLYDLGDEVLARHRALFERLERERVGLAQRLLAMTSAAWLVFALAYCVALAETVRLAQDGRATIGAVVLVLGIGVQLSAQLNELAFCIAWFVRTHRAVSRLVWFEDYAQTAHEDVRPTDPARVPYRLERGIVLEGVTFSYGDAPPVLAGVDLVLPAGKTIAIVGENGAGKTTLVKLLARLYEPTAGRVLVDGVDLRRFDVAEWRARISAGFQDFGRFAFVARESVGIGDLPESHSEAQVQSALERAAAGALPAELPSGLATQLGREFDGGVDLSVGQWQKVALGRAMMRPAPLLLVLDEPTASLDAPTEHSLFERFAAAAQDAAAVSGAITILVSHRFSTVRMADAILVVSDGRISEAGTHEELLDLGGLYAELYELQASSYR
ncbi:MAG: ABC transporter ATP-binding protein [Gaiellaceae bacterium]